MVDHSSKFENDLGFYIKGGTGVSSAHCTTFSVLFIFPFPEACEAYPKEK